jgi:hypothetical protein
MKKVFITLVSIVLLGFHSIAQISDNAVIPVSVTLQSILRLNVVSGGNIEFVVNNLTQYASGIANSDRYDTHFTVSSSQDFNVDLFADAATLVGSNDAANTLNVDNIGWFTTADVGAGVGTVGTEWDLNGNAAAEAAVSLVATNTAQSIVESYDGLGAGDVNQNQFVINWELATAAVTAAGGASGTLLSQGKPADRYTTTVYLNVYPVVGL